MKSFLKEYTSLIMYTISGILLILGAYNILINFNHASFISTKVTVSDLDSDYVTFKNNVVEIEEKGLLNYGDISLLKKDGVYHLMTGEKLSYLDLYQINNYFLDTIINNIWVSKLKTNSLYNSAKNTAYINMLINNAQYINRELLNNSNYHYDVKKNNVRSEIQENYKMILKNYQGFSSFLLMNNNSGGDIDD